MAGLHESDLDPDPFLQFANWFEQALALRERLVEPTAMTLATASAEGVPSARMVLLKGFDERGFVFYTNYASAKARDLAENPRAALVLYWAPLERQVRLAGTVARVTPEESRAYFDSRPRAARLGAWASRQSAVIPDRASLEAEFAETANRFAADELIPLPLHWGGFRLTPHSFEFWQARPGRLHDRLRYTWHADGAWQIERLSP